MICRVKSQNMVQSNNQEHFWQSGSQAAK